MLRALLSGALDVGLADLDFFTSQRPPEARPEAVLTPVLGSILQLRSPFADFELSWQSATNSADDLQTNAGRIHQI